MKHPNLSKQDHSDPTALSFGHLGSKFHEQRLDIAPRDIAAGGAGKNQFDSALVLPPHDEMVL